MDARYLTLPAVAIITLIIASCSAAWSISNFKNDVSTQISTMSVQVTSLQTSVTLLAKQIEDMNSDTEAKAKRRWSRLDMKMWCKDTEDTNRDPSSGKKGFTCGAIGPSSLDGATQ